MEIPILVVVALKGFDAVCGAVYGRIGDMAHELGQGAAVIDLRMVCNDIVDFLQINCFLQVLDILFCERKPGRIDQGYLFFFDEIRIIGRCVEYSSP